MPETSKWLSTAQFAEAAGISPQAARKALRDGLKGQAWRGRRLKVRHALVSGGRGGLGYEVECASLPRELTAQIPSETISPSLPQADRAMARGQDARVLARLAIITPALQHPAQSPARSDAVMRASFDGLKSPRTLYRWISNYEDNGIRGLARAAAANANRRRVRISRVFDRAFDAAGYADALLAKLTADFERALKGLWMSRAEQAGSTELRRLAEFLLLELCEAQQVDLPREAFRLSRRGVERFAHYRVVNQRRNDRKAFDDAKPRIRRDWTGLAPMERVVADVKHLDVIVTREDGSPAWPKIVAFMDAGTGRVFAHPVLLERGEGVRQEHVIEAFLAMVAQPTWGFPQGLYLDNGSEFGALVKIDGALQLLNHPGARTIIFARPYNASAKPIESLFARLDRYVFALLPGYAGPNRMAKKTQTVGKPPKPYPGAWDDFCATLRDLIGAHNLRPVGGAWAGASPQDWLQQKIAAGWQPATVEASALDAAFADPDSRRVDRGIVKVSGQRYSHPGLAALPSRTVVDLALPWRRGAPPLARIAGSWVYLEREVLYPARWVEGARESSRRQASQSQHVTRLAREAPEVDPVATKIRWAKRMGQAPDVPPGAQVDLGDEIEARVKAERSAREAPAGPSKAELHRAREMARTQRLEAAQARHD
ncbi:MAG: hypothetical protein KKE02_14755 [Alphaproteobacteria bacterium]|nr:hypothetical protein [Alphaproteobacteria bacterium]MBU1513254.1 hypothetical protein [Alphaproteobacteria bacterium]MBU2095362.1 hypothetical protein [Alphaproteobacteria bacterium]MBU2152277.1 hypothetical protein [Alphaproteobacteria bacterium]MBU2306676.1 hypothetical protein [Alphaproteobacteria bacterium]